MSGTVADGHADQQLVHQRPTAEAAQAEPGGRSGGEVADAKRRPTHPRLPARVMHGLLNRRRSAPHGRGAKPDVPRFYFLSSC